MAKEVKKVAPKAKEAPKKEVKKEPAKKAETKKVEVKPVAAKKEEVKPTIKSDGKYYVITKSEKGWEVRLAQTKGAAGKTIKTLKTKPEAEAFVNDLSERNGRSAVIHNSKGANKGKATKVKK